MTLDISTNVLLDVGLSKLATALERTLSLQVEYLCIFNLVHGTWGKKQFYDVTVSFYLTKKQNMLIFMDCACEIDFFFFCVSVKSFNHEIDIHMIFHFPVIH